MGSKVWHKPWRLMVPVLLGLLTVGGLVVPTRAATTDGYNVSQQNQTTQQAVGANLDGSKVCVVWTQFDLPDPQVYARLYSPSTEKWIPALGVAPLQVSVAGNVNRPRCTVDTAGNAHIVWNQKNGTALDVAHRVITADGTLGTLTVLDGNRSSIAVDAAPDGRVWAVYRHYVDNASSELVLRSWSGGTWGGAKALSTGGGADEPRIAVDGGGTVHLLYKNGTGGSGTPGISYCTLSTGGTFGPQIAIPNGTNTGAASLAVDRGTGDVHVVFVKDFTQVFYARKPTGGNSFALTQIATGVEQVDDPSIAWSAAGLTVIYNNRHGAEIDRQTSGDRGQTWGTAGVLAAPGGGISAPALTAASDGTAYIVYNHKADSSVYFTTLSIGTVLPPAGSAAPTPKPSATPSTTPTPSATPSTAPKPSPVGKANPATPATPIIDGTHDFFPQTGHNLGGTFRSYWLANGGLDRFGYPLTEEHAAVSPDDGQLYTVQYFERVRFEYHPLNNAPYNVLLSRFGAQLHPLDPPVAPLAGSTFVPVTGHNIDPTFLAYWQTHGGLATFGYPLSEPFTETNPSDGKQYRVQYFERNRFEYHPENVGGPYEVLLGLLGRQELIKLGYLDK